MAWVIGGFAAANRRPATSVAQASARGANGGEPHRSVWYRPVRFVGHGDASLLDSTSYRPYRPHQPQGAIEVDEETLAQSLAILDGEDASSAPRSTRRWGPST